MTIQHRRQCDKIQNRIADATRAQLDVRPALTPALIEESVIIAVQVKIEEGRMSEARQMWLDYKRSLKGN